MKNNFMRVLVISRVRYLLALVITCMSFTFFSGCVDDDEIDAAFAPVIKGLQPDPNAPRPWWPGYPIADSVSYLNKDSIILYGHFKPEALSIYVRDYYFSVSESEVGVSTNPLGNFKILENVKWEFKNLDTVIVSTVKIASLKPTTNPKLKASFCLWIHVFSPTGTVPPIYDIKSNNEIEIKRTVN